MILNNKQDQAVHSNNNYIRVVAGAGSGKTRVLTERIKRLLLEGVEASSILAITFTNKAANEMKARVGNDDVNISTIHALCVKILRSEYWNPKFRILDASEQLDVLKDLYEEQELDEKTFKPKESLDYILYTKLKRLDTNFKKPESKPWAELYDGYIKKLEEMFAMDFDDLIINTAEAMRNEEIKNRWANKFKYILVDEFQDTDGLQYEIIKALTTVHNKLFVVGDGDQMIYSWRGSDEKIFNNFDKDFPGCETITLDQNYRSTPNILNKANVLIENNVERLEKNLFTECEEGTDVKVKEFYDAKEEAKYIVNEILSSRGRNKNSDNAILYRTNFMSKTIERELVQYGVPYEIFGGFKFYDRKEIKDMMGYLKFIQYRDDLTLKRIINTPARKIGKSKIREIADMGLKNLKSMWEVLDTGLYQSKETDAFIKLIKEIETLNFEEIIPTVCLNTGYINTLDSDDQVDNIGALNEEIKEFKKNNPESTLEDYLTDVALIMDKLSSKEEDKVKLMTIHTSKGLEFKNVYVIGLTEGIFPKNNDDCDEEERRLAYVAITRAKEKLTLCSERTFYKGFAKPSLFIEEVGGFTEPLPKFKQERNYWDY